MPRKKVAGGMKSTGKSRPAFGRILSDDPDDAPELMPEFFRRAEIRHGSRVVRPGRPPLGTQPKSAVTLRLDADVLASYRATGAGWQTRLNADLRKVRKLGAPTSRRAG
jgi:uncharacterized protein (DUF4415 family)